MEEKAIAERMIDMCASLNVQISVSGNYIPTCCGCFLDQLVRHPLPIREGKPIDEGSDVRHME